MEDHKEEASGRHLKGSGHRGGPGGSSRLRGFSPTPPADRAGSKSRDDRDMPASGGRVTLRKRRLRESEERDDGSRDGGRDPRRRRTNDGSAQDSGRDPPKGRPSRIIEERRQQEQMQKMAMAQGYGMPPGMMGMNPAMHMAMMQHMNYMGTMQARGQMPPGMPGMPPPGMPPYGMWPGMPPHMMQQWQQHQQQQQQQQQQGKTKGKDKKKGATSGRKGDKKRGARKSKKKKGGDDDEDGGEDEESEDSGSSSSSAASSSSSSSSSEEKKGAAPPVPAPHFPHPMAMGHPMGLPMPGMWPMRPPPPPPIDPVEAFLSQPRVKKEVASRFRALPSQLQQAIMGRGSLRGTRNPSGVLLMRIREAEEGQGGSDGAGGNAGEAGRDFRKSAKDAIEDLIDEFKLSAGCAWMLRSLAPEKQKLASKIDPTGQDDPSGYVAEQLRSIV